MLEQIYARFFCDSPLCLLREKAFEASFEDVANITMVAILLCVDTFLPAIILLRCIQAFRTAVLFTIPMPSLAHCTVVRQNLRQIEPCTCPSRLSYCPVIVKQRLCRLWEGRRLRYAAK
ncbi:hypothetical protein BC936DRAFT_145238 [Jimgerdemannia flammicorona]|uniref:Uncharacterized protein n=1 Tax=Jimgerdemannia flammicorona TaxID=994334 RepID=A0A433DAH9_9FUNG|nr:hypothetical protein BC936DRAFT_145238 [Jimgerdemannia flammicorona]